MIDVHATLLLPDAVLLRQCLVQTFRGSGPGGQKRNKTDSAVRIQHTPSGLTAQSDDSRSQHDNRRGALWRLRWKIALNLRTAHTPETLASFTPAAPLAQFISTRGKQPGRKRIEHLLAVAALLDLFAALECSVRDTAQAIGLSTGALSRLLLSQDELAHAVNTLRKERQLHPLR